MTKITEQEFLDLFLTVKERYNIEHIDLYTKSVINDFNNYNTGYKSDVLNKTINSKVPSRYSNHIFEYFILYHFSRYFLDGLNYTISINNSFSKIDKINSIVLEDTDGKIDSFIINQAQQTKLVEDYKNLTHLFSILAKDLMGKDCNPNDFINMDLR
ncbi:MAG: hypothetical protein JWP12_1399 [Bacteroidetes bacterium]|nr:hypothetical protein [Bacteroidota bacterium]